MPADVGEKLRKRLVDFLLGDDTITLEEIKESFEHLMGYSPKALCKGESVKKEHVRRDLLDMFLFAHELEGNIERNKNE